MQNYSGNILLVEDEEHLQEAIKLNLEMEGYHVVAESRGSGGLEIFKNGHFNLVILDVMLPEMDGFTICENIRKQDTQVPILFLTAKNTGEDRITGLKLGADDYLAKPFNLEELLLRVHNLIKRTAFPIERPAEIEQYVIAGKTVHFNNYEIQNADGKKIPLTKKETLLLKLLIEHKDEVVSRETIMEQVWGGNAEVTPRTIDNFILTFRKYFEENPREPKLFHSMRGVGYKFSEK